MIEPTRRPPPDSDPPLRFVALLSVGVGVLGRVAWKRRQAVLLSQPPADHRVPAHRVGHEGGPRVRPDQSAVPAARLGRAWAGTIKWGKLTHARVAHALKNPTYAGVYTFGKTREVRAVLPDGSVRSTRRRRAREDWTVLIEDPHEGYISWPEFLSTEAKLAANNTKRGARPAREGTALCQGIIMCGACGGRVGTRYSRKDRKVTYKCAEPTVRCRTVTADTVDDAVAALFLQTMTPRQIAVALAAADEVADRQVRTHRTAELAAERARYEADRAERSFSQGGAGKPFGGRNIGVTVGDQARRAGRG